jgi:Protein of unknown function (DUF742)
VSPLRPADEEFPAPADYDPPSYDIPPYGPPSYDAPGYDAPGYDAPGYEASGYEGGYEPQQYERPEERTGVYERPAEFQRPALPDQQDGAGYDPGQLEAEQYDEDLPRVRTGRRASAVRPYVRTGGRTRSHRELALETLVSVSRQRPRGGRPANREYRRVVDLCDVPRSIAEVAALTSVPVGVARVLVGDLAAQGLLTVHQTRDMGAPTDMALMQRVLAGLRNL